VLVPNQGTGTSGAARIAERPSRSRQLVARPRWPRSQSSLEPIIEAAMHIWARPGRTVLTYPAKPPPSKRSFTTLRWWPGHQRGEVTHGGVRGGSGAA
jgi:hypothetical protein